MKNEQFTPGEWYSVIDTYNKQHARVMSNIGGYIKIAELNFDFYVGTKDEEVKANANLIAAAPDMYEALKELHDWLMTQPAKFENEPRIKQAKVALLKAVKI